MAPQVLTREASWRINSSVFTSESVSEGHPDKVCDQISDAILDALLCAMDPNARVACETLVKTGMVVLAGEITTSAEIDYEQGARARPFLDIGYDSSEVGFDGASCAVLNALGKQSPDIAMGVDEFDDHEQGAGDQGHDVWLTPATRPTFSCRRQSPMRTCSYERSKPKYGRSGQLKFLRPDAKSQVTFRYDQNGVAQGIEAVVLSTQHDPDISLKDLQEAVMEEIIKPVLPANWLSNDTKYFINPTGNFVIGGPVGDCGLTGRKIIVDTYGGMARHGGGAFSGKDPSKVDRSADLCGALCCEESCCSGHCRSLRNPSLLCHRRRGAHLDQR